MTVLLTAIACRKEEPAAVTNAKPATPAPPGAAKTNIQIFPARGEIKELKTEGKTVVIKHEEVTNYMAAMTMPFEVKETNELAGLAVGDRVTFRILATEKEGWIDQVKKVGHATVAELPSRGGLNFRQVRDVERLKEGDLMADYHFTNQLGQAVSLGQFRGQALAFTFIFTRCPFPNFCPRMTDNFGEAYRQLAKPGASFTNWALLSISFDPTYDTPETLKTYSSKYQFEPARWNFATGALIDIDAITEQFGLFFARAANGVSFDHNLRTVVVDATGKIQKILVGNEWKPEELVAEMTRAAAAK
ncbi:MAG TPA: SCO family protein [Verrucomicrobiae bacterium]|nr:SCO family protein [Verrucomicrobiae bacterium]